MKKYEIFKQEIENILASYQLCLYGFHELDGKQRIEVIKCDEFLDLPESISIMGIKFKPIDGIRKKYNEPFFTYTFECVFSNEVLANSVKISFAQSQEQKK